GAEPWMIVRNLFGSGDHKCTVQLDHVCVARPKLIASTVATDNYVLCHRPSILRPISKDAGCSTGGAVWQGTYGVDSRSKPCQADSLTLRSASVTIKHHRMSVSSTDFWF